MDNNTDKSQDEQPVFSSTQIVNTKSRTSGPYFTNVQDATLGQKISNWFAKFRRDSEARSEARSAALKAKIAQKKRDADIAAISINLPDNANSISNPALVKSPVYAEQIAAEAQKKKSNKPLLIVLIIVIILLIIGVLLAILRPWETQATGSTDGDASQGTTEDSGSALVYNSKGEVVGIDMSTATVEDGTKFLAAMLNTVDIYDGAYGKDGSFNVNVIISNIDKVINQNLITNEDEITLFQIEKARFYMIAEDYDAAWSILSTILEKEDDLLDSQKSPLYVRLYDYYTAQGNTDLAQQYVDKYNKLPHFEGGE